MAPQTVGHPILGSSPPPLSGSFGDRRVVLHCASDASALDYLPVRSYDDRRVAYYQDHDGPTHLVIGRHADAAALKRASIRFGVDVEALQQFQAGGI